MKAHKHSRSPVVNGSSLNFLLSNGVFWCVFRLNRCRGCRHKKTTTAYGNVDEHSAVFYSSPTPVCSSLLPLLLLSLSSHCASSSFIYFFIKFQVSLTYIHTHTFIQGFVESWNDCCTNPLILGTFRFWEDILPISENQTVF